MVFNVNEATSFFDVRGFAKPAHYQVTVTGPGRIEADPDPIQMPEVEGELRFRTDSVTIPGRGALTTEMHTYGPPQTMAYESQYPPVETTVMLSPDMRERVFFERWQDVAIGFIRSTDEIRGGFSIGYYADYIGTVTIDVFDPASAESIYRLTLREAWPATISGINMNWGDDADVAKLLIGWRYRYYIDGYREDVSSPVENVPPATEPNSVEPLK